MKVSDINKKLRTIEYAGELFVNLQELRELLRNEPLVEMEETLITPYYIQDNKRLELYQYEFCCTEDCTFEDYILTQTGKNQIKEVPQEIIYLRKKCFATYEEENKLKDYIDFIFENRTLQNEVVNSFGNYTPENLYAIVY